MDTRSEGGTGTTDRLWDDLRKLDPGRLVGGVARAFDLISSNYSWRDPDIEDLTLRRLRQVQATILQRKLIDDRARRSEISWQTRMICQFIAYANTQTSKEGVNELADVAATLDMDDPEMGKRNREQNREAQAAPAEPKPGSFESIMGIFGPKLDHSN